VRRPDLAVGFTLVAIFAAMVVIATGYPAAARLMPLAVGLPALGLAVWELERQWRVRPAVDAPAPPPRDRSRTTPFAWLVGFVLAIVAGGFVIGGVAAVAALQRFWLRESWRVSIVGAVAAFGVLFGGIERGLGQPLFEGLITAWVRTWLGT
jgi:hypothetical protein